MLFKLHQIYPEIFKEGGGFMGASKGDLGIIDRIIWELAKKQIFFQEGHFDSNGKFLAPIVCYKVDKEIPFSGRYVLFQQGSYQILPESYSKEIERGEILIHRGIKEDTEFIPPKIEERFREEYMQYLAWSFLSPIISLGYNRVCRSETDHLHKKLYKYPNGITMDIKRLEQSFSLYETLSKTKFGPNFVTYKTPLDNIRLLTKWCGEGEVFLLDPERAERII